MNHRAMKAAAFTTLLSVLVSATGCATIINGRSQDVSFASSPPGAMVKLDNGVQTTTPGKITLKRNQDYNAVVSKEGFPERKVQVESKPSWWLLGNLLIGGLIGFVIDLAAGGGFKLVPDSIDIDLASGELRHAKQE